MSFENDLFGSHEQSNINTLASGTGGSMSTPPSGNASEDDAATLDTESS